MALRNMPLKSDGSYPFLTLSFLLLAVLLISLLAISLPVVGACLMWWFNTKLSKNYSIEGFCQESSSIVQFFEKPWLVLPPEAESWRKLRKGQLILPLVILFDLHSLSLQNNPEVWKVYSAKVLLYFFGHQWVKSRKRRTCKTEKKIAVIIIAIWAESWYLIPIDTFKGHSEHQSQCL